MANAWPAEPMRRDHCDVLIHLLLLNTETTNLATELLGERHQSNGSDDYLDNTVNASSEKAGRGTSKTNLLEDLGSVVVNRVCAGPLLPEHEDDSKGRAVEHLLVGASRLELSDHRHLLVSVEVCNDIVELLDNIWVINGLATNVSERLGCFGDAVLFDEPAGALVHEDDTNKEADTGQHLQGERYAPLGRVVATGDVETDAVVDKE